MDLAGGSPPLKDQLDFSTGLLIKDKVCDNFSTPVHPCPPSTPFFLVVSFGRASFRLDLINVKLALEACLGVDPDQISLIHLSGRTFRFSVYSKAIGFFIYKLRSYECAQFICFFHLWGSGGPNWIHEESLYYKELDAEWTTISKPYKVNQSRKKGHTLVSSTDQSPNGSSYARSSVVLTGANSIALGSRVISSHATLEGLGLTRILLFRLLIVVHGACIEAGYGKFQNQPKFGW